MILPATLTDLGVVNVSSNPAMMPAD